jgi:hypothetical protein
MLKNNIDSKSLKLGKLNCENSTASAGIAFSLRDFWNYLTTCGVDFCLRLGIDKYPSLLYFGYGNLGQAENKNLPKTLPGREKIVSYDGELYLDALYDWVLIMNTISYYNRAWTRITGFLGFSGADNSRISHLEAEISTLRSAVNEYDQKLSRYEAIELFDSIKDAGDPFPALHAEEPSEVCVFRTKSISADRVCPE